VTRGRQPMMRPTILCPVDFSDASRGAARYARLIAEYFGSRLVMLAVEDPLLAEAADLSTGTGWTGADTRRELARFVSPSLQGPPLKDIDITYEVAVGKPAEQILRSAQSCDLIVMSTHGLTGMRKLFFGSTTERVLRETTIPVLTTPPTAEGPWALEEVRHLVGRILVPVDLSESSLRQVQIARAIAEALGVPFIVTSVLEPIRSPFVAKLQLSSVELERKARAEDALAELIATVPRRLHPEALVAYGDPAEEISKTARDRQAGLIVLGLHGSPMFGARMGSVTYRVLCLAPALVLALPPAPHAAPPEAAAERRGLAHT